MRRVLALLSSALLGAVLATGLATRTIPYDPRPAPPVRAPAATELAIQPSLGYFAAREVVRNGSTEGEVLAGGEVVVRIRTPWGPSPESRLAPYERALVMCHRLNELLAEGASGSELQVEANGSVRIVGRGRVVVVVDPLTARANGSSPYALARKWRGSLAAAIDRLSHPRGQGDTTAAPAALVLCSLQHDEYAPEPHFRARENRPGGREVGEVVVGDVVVFRLMSHRLELSPYERAIIAAKRLNDFVADYGPDAPLRLQEREEAGEVDILGGEILIITADPETARAHGLQPKELAQHWLTTARQVLASPPTDTALPFEAEPALATEPGEGAGDTPEPEPPERRPNDGTLSAAIISASSGAQVGEAEMIGRQADVCAAVVLVEGTYDRAARVRALVPVAEWPAGGRGGERLQCGVAAFRWAQDDGATAWRASAVVPTSLTHRPVQGGFGLSEMLKVAGIEEGVRWFSGELDRFACSLAASIASPPTYTVVVPARQGAGGACFAAAQFVLDGTDVVAPAYAAVEEDPTTGVFRVTPVPEADESPATNLTHACWLGAWIELAPVPGARPTA